MMMAAMNITTKVAISLGSAEREYSGALNFSSGKLGRRCLVGDYEDIDIGRKLVESVDKYLFSEK